MLNNEMIEKCCELVGWEYKERAEYTNVSCSGDSFCYLDMEEFVKVYYPHLLDLTIEAIEDKLNGYHKIITNEDGNLIGSFHDNKGNCHYSSNMHNTRLGFKEYLIDWYFDNIVEEETTPDSKEALDELKLSIYEEIKYPMEKLLDKLNEVLKK